VRRSWERALKTIQPKKVPAQSFTWGFSCFAYKGQLCILFHFSFIL
jgi:hypothetical protein